MWGQVGYKDGKFTSFGIIPTRVGTRTSLSTVLPLSKDHPHACGDKLYKNTPNGVDKGSSPRVWGQVQKMNIGITDNRIIPTRVGTSAKGNLKSRYQKDHPHACGDKFAHRSFLTRQQGSSPRVWGQGLSWKQVIALHRIIPTRVGTSG